MKLYVNTLTVCVIMFFIGVLLGTLSRQGARRADAVEVKTDTVTVRDTIIKEKPVSLATRTIDTMLVAVCDTVVLRDTVFLSLPREERVYQDSTFRSVVSGYRPTLDAITVYPTTKYITTERVAIQRKRWGIGVQAGYGWHLSDDRIRGAPSVGVGLSYNIIMW